VRQGFLGTFYVSIKESGADAVLITLVGGASVGFNRAFGSFGLSDNVVRLGTLIEENTLAGIGAENAAMSLGVHVEAIGEGIERVHG